MASAEPAITGRQISLLRHLAPIDGCDIYGYGDAVDGRALQAAGLAVIVDAVNPPKNGAARQPYFGIAITEAGREFLRGAWSAAA